LFGAHQRKVLQPHIKYRMLTLVSVKVEYLYVDLGRVNTTFATLFGCFGRPGAVCVQEVPETGTVSSRITDNMVRLWIDDKFGG